MFTDFASITVNCKHQITGLSQSTGMSGNRGIELYLPSIIRLGSYKVSPNINVQLVCKCD